MKAGKNPPSNDWGFISCMIQSQTEDIQIVKENRDQKEVIAGPNILSLKITVDF